MKVHDEAPGYRLRATRKSFVDEGVTRLKYWPAQSSDLNILEQMWRKQKKKSSSEESVQTWRVGELICENG